jgi:hypothetical protein
MISSAKCLLSFAALAALAALPAAAEDLTIVSTVKAGDHQATSTQYLTADRARMATADTDMIVEYSTGRIVQINHKSKEYSETSLAEMAAAAEKIAAEMDKMPAFARKMMPGGTVGQITVKKGAATRKIAGYDCTQYTLSMGEDLVFDLWVTPALEWPAQLVDAQKATFAAMGPAGRRFVAMFDEMKKIKGVSLATGMNYKMMGKQIDNLTEASEVRRGPIPASTFAIPAGYKQKASPFKR